MRISSSALVITGLVVVGFGGAVLISHRGGRSSVEMKQARYYCPMHPSYTSDKPGDCPICNMKLVKADEASSIAGTATAKHREPSSGSFASICYLHNCSKWHGGKPCPMTVVAKPGENVICPICGSHVAEAAQAAHPRKILYWTDPMIPNYRAQGPGTSPMGMELVPVYEEEQGSGPMQRDAAPQGYAPVLLTPQKQQLIGITTAVVESRALVKTIRTVGVVAHDPELYQTQEEFIQAYQAWQRAKTGSTPEVADQARQLVESSRLRLRHLGLSDRMIDDVSTWTQPDHRLLLGGAGEFWVYAPVYEYELPLVHQDEEAAIEANGFPGRLFRGIVKAVDPMLDPATRTTRIRIVVEDPEGLLKPEMYTTVSIRVDLGQALAIPEGAVFATGEQQIVFMDQGQGVFEPRAVVLGPKADGYYQLQSGVAAGERVVTSGNFLIDSESRLKGARQNVEGAGHSHGP